MSTAMYDAREAMIPGSVYDRSSTGEKEITYHFSHLNTMQLQWISSNLVSYLQIKFLFGIFLVDQHDQTNLIG